jgi:hypothetical protein
MQWISVSLSFSVSFISVFISAQSAASAAKPNVEDTSSKVE